MSIHPVLDTSSSLRLELSTAQALCEIVNTPRSLAIYLLIKYHEFKQLVDISINPCNYQDPQHFADDYLVTSLLQKSSNLPLAVDKREVALASFLESERRCSETNKRVLAGNHPMVIQKAQRLIRKVLGPLTKSKIQKIESLFRFGPGATTGVQGCGSVSSDKYDASMHLTAELIPFYKAILGERWWEHQRNPIIVEGNKFTTVPKNAKTDRGICVEPTLNIFAQLGVGTYLKRFVLTRLGIDLYSQSRNQFLASQAHSRHLATIDLSAASDSMSWGTVMELLPPDWFELFELLRSPFTNVDGEWVENEKFSSMGNGYTFELETLVFASVAFSIVPLHEHYNVSVYGDDIIVPQQYAYDVIDALEYLGFSVNAKKSFLAGNFFESCGTDWFKGQNVRPFFLRQDVGSKIPYTVQIANALRLYASRRLNGFGCDSRFRAVWQVLYKLSPKVWRSCKVPAELGDTGFIVSEMEHKCRRLKHSLEGFAVRHVLMRPRRRRKKTFGYLLYMLACGSTSVATKGYLPVRGYLNAPVLKTTTVQRWSSGLQWV